MTTLLDLVADLTDRLQDAGHNQVPLATKKRFINYGIAATWPRLYITARDTTLTYDESTTDYSIPAAVGDNSKLLRVEIETGVATGIYNEILSYDVIPGLTDPVLSFPDEGLHTDGARIRITAALRVPALSLDADVYEGPSGTDELPVLYAMGLCTARALDNRIDHRRYSSTQGTNGVGPADIMEASQFWFAQFELLLERMALPLPAPSA